MRFGGSPAVALCALCLLALLELVPANNHPFYTNSRYGKRAPGPGSGVARLWSASRRSGNVEPRADKFFLNTRYGKRDSAAPDLPQQTGSEERVGNVSRRSRNVEPPVKFYFPRYGKRDLPPSLLQQALRQDGPLMPAVMSDAAEDASGEGAATLACQYTGVHDLFRCFTRKESGPRDSGDIPDRSSEESPNQ